MKPITLKFQAFGPFVEEQTVSFEDFRKDGLFLICGPTGAGKTTILDAMTMALFNETGAGEKGLPGQRSKWAPPALDTRVEFTFELGDHIYRFRRSMKKKPRSEGFNEEHLAYDESAADKVIADKDTRVTAEAERILGLTADQFTQIMLLPQGKFQRLLEADTKDKEEVLKSIFHTERWDRAVNRLKERLNDQNRVIAKGEAQKDAILSGAGVKTFEELQDQAAALKEALPALQAAEAAAEGQSKKAREGFAAGKELAGRFRELDNAEKTLADLLLKKDAVEADRMTLANAQRAIPAEDAERELSGAKREAANARAAAENAKREVGAAEAALQSAEARQKEYAEKKPKRDAAEQRLKLLMEKTGTYEQLSAGAEKLQKGEADVQRAKRAVAGDEGQLSALEQGAKAAADACSAAKAALDRAQLVYNQNAAARLQRELKAGCACPVCRQLVAVLPEIEESAETVTDADLERLKRAAAAKETALKKAEQDLGELKQGLEGHRAELAAAEKTLADAKAALEQLKMNLAEGIPDLQALTAAKAALQGDIKRFDDGLKKLEEGLSKNREALAAAKAAFVKAAEDLQVREGEALSAEGRFAEALRQAGITAEEYLRYKRPEQERNRLSGGITEYDTRLQGAKEQAAARKADLQGFERPDLNVLQAALESADKALKEAHTLLLQEQNKLQRMEQALSDAGEMLRKLEEQQEAYEREKGFYELLSPTSGVKLSTYAIRLKLRRVLDAANRLLLNVHGGRYEIRPSDDKVGSARMVGLNFMIYDRYNDEERPVNSLSGGEKFLAALCLAIGLSETVQSESDGIPMETMFVDEGFGSLDPASIEDALKVLEEVRSGRGLIGIISHVEKLKESVSARITVEKTAQGSSLRY